MTGEGAWWQRAECRAASVLTEEREHPPWCPTFYGSRLLLLLSVSCLLSTLEVRASVFQAPRLGPFTTESTCVAVGATMATEVDL